MKKVERQRLIRKIIKDYPVKKQEEFVELLNQKGVDVTQATISRDIKDLKLVKVSNEDGSFYYSTSLGKTAADSDKLNKMLQVSVLHFDVMDKNLVLKTIPGSATALGMLVEKVYDKELFTVLTTDDKVLMIFKTELSAETLEQSLATLIYG
ncbi:arginine repressor [Vagococcus salmoninarum]|uniref:Arginine repressor n=1 Tax=Vagococcus salmoninarum TaxID=2739 RepID=A0A429ZLL4_9ENTE|nr:ArgR family transcriptional regulator [Vagococcus salmoninarum]MBE9388789.1 ArgR family transcriptional regulator [Vagococcus salmoninarum]RST94546.1 hypothetical protein CBF35_09855 [Vagococcus salmoninarum]